MTESQRKWLMYLQSKGVEFEWLTGCDRPSWKEFCARFDFNIVDGLFAFQFRISAQPIPDIPDWRELCWEMRSKGILFAHKNPDGIWVESYFHEFAANEVGDRYQIPQQPIPEWREEMTEEKIFGNLRITDADLLEKIDQYMKDHPDSVVPVDEAQIARITELIKDVKIDEETKPDQKEETPHLELQIQWHEDMLHHLRTGEPMPVWEYRLKNGDGEWKICHDPHFSEKYEYRRKPRTVAYWHCLCKSEYGTIVTGGYESKEHLIQCLMDDGHIILSPITETTVELED